MSPFAVRMRLRNKKPSDVKVIIYAGTIVESQDPQSRVQNLAVARDVAFTIPAGATQTVTVSAWCLNHHYQPPSGTPMRVTSLSAKTYANQQAAWDDMDARR